MSWRKGFFAQMEKFPIFDVDTHYAEPPDLWTSRAPSKFKDRVLHVEGKANGTEAWFIEGREIAMIGPSVVNKDLGKHLNAFTIPTFENMHPASTYAEDRLSYMDSHGVAAQIIYPNVIGFGAYQLMKMAPDDVELRQWHVTAYNDALIDLQKDGKGRLLPQAALPLWDLDASLKELERIRKLGLTGIAMSDKPADFGQPPLADPKWDRFFATCQDLGLPINFHIGSGSFEGELGKWWSSERTGIREDGSLNGPLCVFGAVNNFLNNFQDVANLILQGILEKYPKLNFVSVESGVGWLPFVIQGLEHNWAEMTSKEERARFKRSPKEQFVDQIYASYWFEKKNCVDLFIDEFGDNNIMFQTDFPHPTSLYPNIRDKAQETLGHHSVETQKKVLFKNAERVYGVALDDPKSH